MCLLATAFLALLSFASAQTPSYFVITSPALNDTWTSSGLNVVKWAASTDQGISGFDVELLRLSNDGILPIARLVPLTWSALNINLQGTPPGDDYFVVFLNYDSSIVYSVSARFSIAEKANPVNNAAIGPTVTVSGGPGPTKLFAQTFAPSTAQTNRLSLPWTSIMFSATIGLVYGLRVIHY